MTLTESIEYNTLQHGTASFAIKKYTVILKDGSIVSRSKPETISVNPGDDISMYPAEIQGMCNGYWTQDIVDQYNASIEQV
jgi:hypothetical protein